MKNKILILLSCLFFGLAVFLFFKFRSQQKEVASLRQGYEAATDSLQYIKYKSIGDSLIITEDYDRAMEYFRKADNIFDQHKLEADREELVRLAMSRRDELDELQERISQVRDNMLLVADSLGGKLQQKDSLMRLSRTEINMLMLEAGQLRDSLVHTHEEVEKMAESLGQLEFETDEAVEIYYVGELKDGKADGHGYGLFATGGIYDGEWKDNKRHGAGKYIWKDGNIYEGEYKDDKRHGTGIYYFTTGEKYVGEWKDNKRSGKGVMYGAEGEKVLSGQWENDKIVETEG